MGCYVIFNSYFTFGITDQETHDCVEDSGHELYSIFFNGIRLQFLGPHQDPFQGELFLWLFFF